jgi:stage II sporulation protein GA (sporulation sigma-E factor processing peptidase)
MITEVYADLYFLINTCMNLLCLMITGMLLHRRVSRIRAILGASLGGAYAVLALLFSAGGILGVLTDAGAALLMCAVTFYGKGNALPTLFKCTAVQFLSSMMLGGIMTVLYTALNRLNLPLDALRGDGLSVWIFALLSALAGLLTARGSRFFAFAKRTKSVTVRAHLFGKELTLRAMVDSGNLLRDPVSGRYVIVADREKLRAVLPSDVVNLLEHPLSPSSAPLHEKRMRLIPAKTASSDT